MARRPLRHMHDRVAGRNSWKRRPASEHAIGGSSGADHVLHGLIASLLLAITLAGCAADADPCARPASLEGRWQASIQEAQAAGTYLMELKATGESGQHGSHAFDRVVTYGAGAPQLAGCRETGRFTGTWGVEPGSGFWIVLMPVSGSRSGCSDPAKDGPTFQGNTTSPDKSLLNGAVQSTACELTIKSTVFVRAPAPAAGGAAQAAP